MKKIILLFFLIIFLFFSESYAKVLMKPFLQGINSKTNSIFVLIETDSKNHIVIGYNFLHSNTNQTLFDTSKVFTETDSKPITYIHKVLIKDLKQNSIYQYWIQNQNGEKDYISEFKSPVSNNSNLSFAIFGDCRSNPEIHNKISKDISEKEPNFSIYLGDLCFSKSYKSWKKEFFVENEINLINKVPFANAVGNHEGWKQNTIAFTQSAFSGNEQDISENKPYFDFDNGNCHFVIISTEESIKKGTPQYEFIKKSLENSNKKFKIVALHVPIYCAGGYGDDKNMIEVAKELFIPNKVSMVLAGHTHFYQHNLVDGIHYLILGGGGAPLTTPTSKGFTLTTLKDYNYAIVDDSSGKLTVNVFDENNNLLDKIFIK